MGVNEGDDSRAQQSEVARQELQSRELTSIICKMDGTANCEVTFANWTTDIDPLSL